MRTFKVGDPVRIVSTTGTDMEKLGAEGIIIEAGKRWDGVDLYTTDIPNDKHFGGTHRATEHELDLVIEEPDTREHTLLEWDSEDLIQELQRRGYVVS